MISNILIESGADLIDFVLTIWFDSKNLDQKSQFKAYFITIQVEIMVQFDSIAQAYQSQSSPTCFSKKFNSIYLKFSSKNIFFKSLYRAESKTIYNEKQDK